MTPEELQSLVYEFPTKHKQGFIESEIEELLKPFPNIDKERFNTALGVVTCQKDEKDGDIIYHCDILTALRCLLEDRDMYFYEWD